MKTRIVLLLILTTLLLLSVGAAALSASGYQVEAGTIAGGGYRLTTVSPLADTMAAGGAYRLLGPAVPQLRGSGCCCTYLPCLMREK
jgi:hypothetical protein